ncbi:hypothetical protein KXV85_004983, partial [Aspergillus fumigatus]
ADDSPLSERFAGCRDPLEIPLLRCGGTIRGQVPVLGKQVRAPGAVNVSAFLRKASKRDEYSQAYA